MPTAAGLDLKKEGRARRLSEWEPRPLGPARGTHHFPGAVRSIEEPPSGRIRPRLGLPGEARVVAGGSRLHVWGLMSLVWRVSAVCKGRY